jgi:hypothetical protein
MPTSDSKRNDSVDANPTRGTAVGVPADRAMAIIGLIIAVGAGLMAALLLISIVYGYSLAIHNELPPNSKLGFRDETTRSCLRAWYAAQNVGFSWLLWGAGPMLVLNILFCVFAAIKRRPWWHVLVVAIAMPFLLLIVVVIAGTQAQSAAHAIGC